MWVPNTLPSRTRLSLEILLAQVLVGRVALEVFELGPSILEKLGCEVHPVDLGRSDVARDVVAGRQGVRGREVDVFPHGEGTEELA